jgi:dipeptidyl aminopeptidase/acylaminoacyl peptidase
VFELDVDSGTRRALRSGPPPAESEYVAEPELIEFPTDGGLTAFAVFYPPTNPGYAAPSGELPPLVVKVHGGPTGHVFPMLSVNVLYWTSRGFAVVDVNYGGSSGFGRAYRQRLDGTWGLVDVADSMAAARHLGNTGRVDPDRMVIRGGSAGGYTTLAALAFGDVFSAGASYFGVADIELLADHTHKFESRYIERLCGADRSVWKERSPLYSADHIDVPVVLFQGLEDQVVPPEQAQAIADALAARGVPHAHVTYQGEDHGFRKAENQVHSLETELAFYGRVLGFEPAGDLPEVPLET